MNHTYKIGARVLFANKHHQNPIPKLAVVDDPVHNKKSKYQYKITLDEPNKFTSTTKSLAYHQELTLIE